MRKDKQQALALRKLGKSYSEIKRALGIPKSTLSEWLHKVHWSDRVKKVLAEKAKDQNTVRLRALGKVRGKNLARLYQEARKEAVIEFEEFKFHPLFISGITIYWGEGDKVSRSLLRVSNTDSQMIRLFTQFLRIVCAVPPERIRAWLLLYPDLNKSICEDFWIKKTGLSRKNFNKSIVIKGKHKTKRVRYGVCNVGVSSTYLKQKMNVWLTQLPHELLKGIYYFPK